MLQLPELYNRHLKNQFSYPQYILLLILIHLLQNLKIVRLEELARCLPYPIQLRSRTKKLQRFLSLKQFNPKQLWFPILKSWVEKTWTQGEVIYIVIDRSQWRNINLLMVSLVYNRRGIPIYFELLAKKGSSNLEQQKKVLSPSLELFKEYQVVVLGDREFCGVDLAKWLSQEEQVYLCLRLRKSEYAELETDIWFQLMDLGLQPGTSVYYGGVKMTKTKGFAGLNLAAKWKRDYREYSSKEAWFLLTNLESLSAATDAYSKRMGIEEMFRDLKTGGYNLEETQVNNERLIAIILLITLAYSWSTFSGEIVKQKGIAKYVTRPTEPKRAYQRHSNFSIGLNSITWLNSLAFFQELTQELLSFYPHKQPYYRQGFRAISLIQSVF